MSTMGCKEWKGCRAEVDEATEERVRSVSSVDEFAEECGSRRERFYTFSLHHVRCWLALQQIVLKFPHARSVLLAVRLRA